MTKQTVGPGIVEDYVCGKLRRKKFIRYICKSSAEYEGESYHADIEVDLIDIEKARKDAPSSTIEFFSFEVLYITAKVGSEEITTESDMVFISPIQKIT